LKAFVVIVADEPKRWRWRTGEAEWNVLPLVLVKGRYRSTDGKA